MEIGTETDTCCAKKCSRRLMMPIDVLKEGFKVKQLLQRKLTSCFTCYATAIKFILFSVIKEKGLGVTGL